MQRLSVRRPLGLERLEDRCLLSYAVTDLGTLAGGTFSQGFGLNDRGFVAGIGDIPSPNVDRAVLYTPRTGMLDLGSLNGGASEGFAINGRKEVTGFADVPSAFRAFLASPRRGMEDLGTLGGDLSVGYGINDRAQVTGWSNLSVGTTTHHAFIVDKTSMYDLGTLGGDTSAAYGVNDQGQVTGTAQVGGVSHAFLYSDGAMQDLGTLGGSFSTGYGINNLGQVVGSSQFGGMASHAFLYSDGQMTDLDSLIPPGVTLSDARAINNLGQILANGQDNTTHQSHAYLLTPDDTSAPGEGAGLRVVGGLVPSVAWSSDASNRLDLATPSPTREGSRAASDEARFDSRAGPIEPGYQVLPAPGNDQQPADALADPLAG